LTQAEALHYDKRSLDKLLQHRQAELDSTHARLKAALVRASSPHTPQRRQGARRMFQGRNAAAHTRLLHCHTCLCLLSASCQL